MTHVAVNRRISVAPMMDWTDRHCRYFLRLFSRHTLLYTEMVTTGAILRGDAERFLRFDAAEHPVAVQLGGSDPADLAAAAKIAAQFGYDEINLNVGCPSDRVQSGRFGACLMAEPELVRDCVKAMQDVVDIPVTVKHRIGIDAADSYDHMRQFVETVAASGCTTFIVHARKAVLGGLSPKQNREIPPLKYAYVYRLKQSFPELEVLINGGLTTHEIIAEQLTHVDGAMIGREAYHNPYLLAEVDQRYFGSEEPVLSRVEIIEKFLPYIEQQLAAGTRLNHITRHILGAFSSQPGGRLWRRYLSEHAYQKNAGPEVIEQALAVVPVV